MSRAYRIRIRESVKKVVRSSDHVSTQLEILDVVSPEETQEILTAELILRGFRREGGKLVREEGAVKTSVDASTGEVKVEAQLQQEVEVTREGVAVADSDWSAAQKKHAEAAAREQLRKSLEEQTAHQTAGQQQAATQALEQALDGIRKELDQAVNRVTSEALKRKAGRMGQIKEMSEDVENGSLTIVLEV